MSNFIFGVNMVYYKCRKNNDLRRLILMSEFQISIIIPPRFYQGFFNLLIQAVSQRFEKTKNKLDKKHSCIKINILNI